MVPRTIAIAVLSFTATFAVAAPSCTNWMKQPDGSQWRTCVDDKGKQYCESAKNGQISRVSCR
jgi:hypothetical protein